MFIKYINATYVFCFINIFNTSWHFRKLGSCLSKDKRITFITAGQPIAEVICEGPANEETRSRPTLHGVGIPQGWAKSYQNRRGPASSQVLLDICK